MILALAATVAPTSTAEGSGVAADPPAVTVVGPRRGLARLHHERRPMLLLVVPEAARESARLWFDDLGRSTRKRLERGFIVTRIELDADGAWPAEEPPGDDEVPVPWTEERARAYLRDRVGVVEKDPILLLLDCAGVIVARGDDELPSDARLKKVLSAVLTANANRKADLEKVEKGVEVIGLALKRKKPREACQAFTEIRAIDLPLDHSAAIARSERYTMLKEAYDAAFAVARKLEKEEKLVPALEEYEKVLRNYPLDEWADEVRTRMGILRRKIFGPNPGGTGTGIGGGGR